MAKIQHQVTAQSRVKLGLKPAGAVALTTPELGMLQRQIAERLGCRLVDHRLELFGVKRPPA